MITLPDVITGTEVLTDSSSPLLALINFRLADTEIPPAIRTSRIYQQAMKTVAPKRCDT